MAPDERSGPDTTPDRSQPPLTTTTTIDQATFSAGRFGRPSTYSLDAVTLARHVRDLRRQGWQSWEIRARFDWAA